MVYIEEADMEMEVAQAIKWVGNVGDAELFDIMRRRFESNHIDYNSIKLARVIDRQLADFRRF